jgi:hypothetical protein
VFICSRRKAARIHNGQEILNLADFHGFSRNLFRFGMDCIME